MKIFKITKFFLLFIFLVVLTIGIIPQEGFAQKEANESGEPAVVVGTTYRQDAQTIQAELRLIKHFSPVGEIDLDFPVYGVSFSPDNKFLVTADKNGGIRLWDAAGGYGLAAVLEGHTKEVYGLDFSPDGKYLASGGKDQVIKVWDITTRKLVKTISDYTGTVSSLAFAPDNSVLASANLRNIIEFWTVEGASFDYVKAISGPQSSIYALSFYPNSAYLVSAGKDKEIRIWPLGVKDKVKILRPHTHIVLDVCFSSGGNFLASAGADHLAYLWEVSLKRKGKIDISRNPIISYVHKGWVTQVGFSPDEKYFITAGQYGCLRIWGIRSKKLLKIVPVFPEEAIFSFAFSSDGKYLAVAGKSGKVRIYDWQNIITPTKK